jgi:hypothetical protein
VAPLLPNLRCPQSPSSSSLSYEGEYPATTRSLASGTCAHGLAGNRTDEEGPEVWKAAPGRKDTRDTAGARAKHVATPPWPAVVRHGHNDRPYVLRKE